MLRQLKARIDFFFIEFVMLFVIACLCSCRLRCVGHVQRRPIEALVRRVDVDQMEDNLIIRGGGRLKKNLRNHWEG